MEQAREINVDLGGMRMFAELVEASTEQELKPGAARAENEIQNGPRIGRGYPGGQVAAGRESLTYALAQARENTAGQVNAAEILSVAIKRALENFAEADQDAARQVANIEAMLLESMASAQKALNPHAPSGGDLAQ